MKNCCGCFYYRAYYTKGYFQFNREGQGLCAKHQKLVNKQEDCESWKNNNISKKIRKTICVKALEETMSAFLQIKQILIEEGQEEN